MMRRRSNEDSHRQIFWETLAPRELLLLLLLLVESTSRLGMLAGGGGRSAGGWAAREGRSVVVDKSWCRCVGR